MKKNSYTDEELFIMYKYDIALHFVITRHLNDLYTYCCFRLNYQPTYDVDPMIIKIIENARQSKTLFLKYCQTEKNASFKAWFYIIANIEIANMNRRRYYESA